MHKCKTKTRNKLKLARNFTVLNNLTRLRTAEFVSSFSLCRALCGFFHILTVRNVFFLLFSFNVNAVL